MTPARNKNLPYNPKKNRVLAALPSDCQAQIFPQLSLQTLERGDVLFAPGDQIPTLRFPIDAVVALSYVLRDGAGTLVALVGSEGMTGIRALFDYGQAVLRAQVIVPGQAYTLPVAQFKGLLDGCPGLRDQMILYMDRLINEGQQNAACLAHHTIDQRLSRLLLDVFDRIDSARIKITQEQLADLLAVRREGVSHAASSLKTLGALRYARGDLEVVDRTILEKAACECYQALRDKTPGR